MFSASLEFSEEDDGNENYTEKHLQNFEAVNMRIVQHKSQLGGFLRSELTEDANCCNLDSLVTKSLLDLTAVKDNRAEDEEDNLDGCDNNQDIAGPEQTQLSATILGNTQQLMLST